MLGPTFLDVMADDFSLPNTHNIKRYFWYIFNKNYDPLSPSGFLDLVSIISVDVIDLVIEKTLRLSDYESINFKCNGRLNKNGSITKVPDFEKAIIDKFTS